MVAAAPAVRDDRALLVLVAGALVIGCGPIFVRLSGAGPAATGFWRFAMALPALWLLARREDGRATALKPTAITIFAGLMFAADLAFWHYGIHYTSVANATVLSNLTPVILTAVAWVAFKERPRPLFLAGLALAVAGGATMGIARGGPSGPGANPHLGDLLSVGTSLWYSAYFLAVRRARSRSGAAMVMWRSSLVAAPALLAIAVALREPLLPATALGWAACVGLGAMHVTGQGAIAWALGRLSASLIAVVILVQPVVAAGLGWLVFGEAITPVQAAGALAALAGVALAQAAARRPAPAAEEAVALA